MVPKTTAKSEKKSPNFSVPPSIQPLDYKPSTRIPAATELTLDWVDEQLLDDNEIHNTKESEVNMSK